MNSPVDLIVVGGGINGAAIARDAALRGLTVTLFEKHDFGSGASSKTSKLAHGGVRYLENYQFGLVRESLIERALLLKNAPHLVHPMPFIFPVYKNDPYPVWQVNLGLYLYDHLGGAGAMPKHRKLDVKEINHCFPGLKKEGLVGGCYYMDAQMNDARIVIENMLSAEMAGAIVHNYTPVTGLIIEDKKVSGVSFSVNGCQLEQKGKIVVNATGAWSNQTVQMENVNSKKLVNPTLGVHIVIPQITEIAALLLHAPQDGRVFFIIPWFGNSLVGTTDINYEGDPDCLSVKECDRQYLLDAVKIYFPESNLSHLSIISEFVGLRPLNAKKENTNPDAMARNHEMTISEGGMISIVGGKYTTHRKIAEDVVDVVVNRIPILSCRPCSTKIIPLPGAIENSRLSEVMTSLIEDGLTKEIAVHLCETYGMLAVHIQKIIQEDKTLAKVIHKEFPYIFAEVIYSIKFEHAKTAEDWFCRRTSIAYTSRREMEFQEVIEKLFKDAFP